MCPARKYFFYQVDRLDVLTGNLYFVQQIIYLIKKDLRMYNVVSVSENRRQH